MGKISSLVNSGRLTGSKQQKHPEGSRRAVQINIPNHLFLKLLELKELHNIKFTTNAMVARAVENYISAELEKNNG